MEDSIKRFLAIVPDDSGYGDGYGSGSGDGSGYGSGYGDGYGDGDGDGDGSGYGDGHGSGSGDGSGYGSGYGDGYGDGDGDGDGSGYGDGHGYGYGDGDGYGSGYGDGYGYGDGDGDGDIKTYEGQPIYYIDGVPTLIYSVKGATAARGAIVRKDLTLTPCYIARHGNYFAHGETLKEAVRDAIAKWTENRPLEERIADFVKAHPDLDKPYSGLFEWHHILTGSCEAGRREWCKAHDHQPTDKITIREFILGTVNDYGGDVIRQVAKAYNLTINS